MKTYRETLNDLLAANGLSQKELAAMAEMSPAAISRILNGETQRVRPATHARLAPAAARTPAQLDDLNQAYHRQRFGNASTEAPFPPPAPDADQALTPGTTALLAQWTADVAAELDLVGLPYTADFRTPHFALDFRVTHADSRTTAILLRPGPYAPAAPASWQSTVGNAFLIAARAGVDHVLIVAPYRTLEAEKWQTLLSEQVRIVTKDELRDALRALNGAAGAGPADAPS